MATLVAIYFYGNNNNRLEHKIDFETSPASLLDADENLLKFEATRFLVSH